MDHVWPFILLAFVLVFLELIYFRLANQFNILDKPNNRSSHFKPTIRGGGIIFYFSILIWFVAQEFKWPWLVAGVTGVAMVSFMDDLKSHPARWRVLVQLCAVLFLFHQVAMFDWSWWLLILALVICIGTLNAFNFMDGINGITGVYALINLVCFAYVDLHVTPFTDHSLLLVLMVSVLVFLFFNFRKQAVCFAGDVGSVTIAFVLIFFLLQLIQETGNFLWVIFFLVYGIDSVVTIINRIRNKENIFNPHRSHLYQYLTNELKWPHLVIALLYGILQLLLNIILIYSFTHSKLLMPLIASGGFLLAYLWLRSVVVRRLRKGPLSTG